MEEVTDFGEFLDGFFFTGDVAEVGFRHVFGQFFGLGFTEAEHAAHTGSALHAGEEEHDQQEEEDHGAEDGEHLAQP